MDDGKIKEKNEILSLKQKKRLESKKKKAVALLHLLSSSKMNEGQKGLKRANEEDESSSGAKKAKLDGKSESNATPRNSEDEIQQARDFAEKQLEELRKVIRERQKASMERPKVFMTLDELANTHGKMICKEFPIASLPPLYMVDVQHLLLFAVKQHLSPFQPRWCRLLRVGKLVSCVVISLEGISDDEYQKFPECFPKLRSAFEMSTEMVPPSEYESTVSEEIFNVPLSNNQMRQKFLEREQSVGTDSLIPRKGTPVLKDGDAFPRTQLLLDPLQMMLEGYPLPNMKNKDYLDFVYTHKDYSPVTNQSPVFAIDCEMCITTAKRSELTRISVINENMETVFDTFVKPYNRITNYLTRYSGITKKIMDPVTTRLHDVHQMLKSVIPADAILVGQSLGGDLRALKLFHPYVIDTSVIFNLSGNRQFKTSLKNLAAHFLHKTIQDSEHGHSSVEDAISTMELLKLKLSQSLEFGDLTMGGSIMLPTVGESGDHTSTGDAASSEKDLEGAEKKAGDGNSKEASTKSTSDSENEIIIVKSEPSKEKDTSDSVKRNKAFYCRSGVNYFQNLFHVLKSSNKSAALVEEKNITEKYKCDETIIMETDCDRTSKRLSKSYVQFHDFVFTKFPSFKEQISSPDCTEESIKKHLRKVDNRLWKVIKHIRQNSLAVVIMAGRTEDNISHSARTFIKIT